MLLSPAVFLSPPPSLLSPSLASPHPTAPPPPPPPHPLTLLSCPVPLLPSPPPLLPLYLSATTTSREQHLTSNTAQEHTCLASAIKPDTAMPECLSTVKTLRFEPSTIIFDSFCFSTPSATPSLHRIPTAVPDPSTALLAYSTWKTRPSGENVVVDWSYPVPIEDI